MCLVMWHSGIRVRALIPKPKIKRVDFVLSIPVYIISMHKSPIKSLQDESNAIVLYVAYIPNVVNKNMNLKW